jgi:hypothetical protein
MSLIRDKEADIGRITRQISHDLRGPLGAFERLLFLPPGTSIDEHKFVIRQALARFNHMIESLRNMDEEFTIDSIPCNLDFEIGMYALGAKALKLGKVLQPIAITLTEKVIVDPIKFERAWVNLATNAIDAAESMVCIEFLNEDFDLIVRVKDDGPGVSDEFLPKLFQRGSTYGKADGTGLGLAYVRQIMRGHGGDVTYRRENDLTIFECRLPHAVVWEEAQVMENTLSLDTQLVQNMVRTVAICLEPDSLSRSVLSQLASYKSDDFLFSEERETANIVVSNIDEIMFSVLEGDEQEFIHVSPLWGNEGAIVERLVRKFNLNGEK